MENHLHIICLNVPYPVDYGGVFDLYYKLPALQQHGVKIHLHCFEYGRGSQPVLNQYCESVDYYPRKKGFAALSVKFPFIVKSRSDERLLETLAKDDYPILMEGVHCTYLLNDKRFEQRKCFVRLHNVEHIYYRHLYNYSNSPFKKLYFFCESILLKRYERQIASKAQFLSVVQRDAETYIKLGGKKIHFLPLFLPPWQIKMAAGKGTFCLYQGDLSVAENEKAAIWLAEKVFNNLSIPFVIAGKNPSHRLTALVENKNSICLVANPDAKEMQDLIAKAHINIIPSYNATGIKIKLLNALFNGRYCLVNEATVLGSGLENLVHIADDAKGFRTCISTLYARAFDEDEMIARQKLLYKMFDNERNSKMLMGYIWGN